jgi:outer membrane protein OmpA-like peptidoglycan-associated protein
MKTARTLFISVFLLCFLVSCAAKSKKSVVVVLLPGPDGKTGQIVVYNEGGSRVISEPEQATEIHSATVAPSEPFKMKIENINDDFGEALSALPSPPIHFILYFHTGTTILTEESRKLLAKILPEVSSRKTTDVSVVGHTDTEGTRKMNQQLGMERAMEIKKLLVSQGIDPRIIEVTSHGEGNLLIKTPDDVPEPRNRRVEVILR